MNKHVPTVFDGNWPKLARQLSELTPEETAQYEAQFKNVPRHPWEAVATMQIGLTAEQLEQAKQVPGVEIKIVRHQGHQSDMSNWVKPKWEIPTVPSTEEVHDCGNCLSYQPGTIVCRCDETRQTD